MVVLGVDPGTAITGYGVIRKEGSKLVALDYGVIRTPPHDEPPTRLLVVYKELVRLMEQHHPECLATERLFFAQNEATAFSVGRTIGVVLLAAAERGVSWAEYTPPQVKRAVVGFGRAGKAQVQYMVRHLLQLPSSPQPNDAADALAVAICHAHSTYTHAGKQEW
ncbi:MAG TPA: crossover junction endodeoxyribonuclease RuvC [Chthonomonadales bacterium]|nr:crossover junction endodeoxyribonuclease RuvC [Chthonomonadales bacterium]